MMAIITLFVVGAILMFLETLLPGLITGIVGFLCWVAAVILGYHEYGAPTGNLILIGVLLGMVVGIFFWLKFFPQSRIAGLFISQRTVGELGVEKPDLLQLTGVAISQLCMARGKS